MENQNSSNEVPNSPSLSHDEQDKVNSSNNSTQVVQPQLPPNPSPESLPLINLNKNIIDDGNSSTDNAPDLKQSNMAITVTNMKTNESEAPKKPKVIMCRDYSRGTCRKGASCRFAHKLILSQLPGVYTFCRNFQNAVCTLPKCKYVHATIFEEQHFYRTGHLSPHTLSHLKKRNAQQQPPPLPPPKETQIEGPPSFVNDQLLELTVPCIEPTPELNCATVPSVHENGPQIFTDDLAPPLPVKREWSDIDEFSSSPGDLASTSSEVQMANICKICYKNELSIEPTPELNCATVPSVHENVPQIFSDDLAPPLPVKREWSDIDESSSSSGDLASTSCEPPAKICKTCNKNDLRLTLIQNMFEKSMETSLVLMMKLKRLNELNEKISRLSSETSDILNPQRRYNITSAMLASNDNVRKVLAKLIVEYIKLKLRSEDDGMMTTRDNPRTGICHDFTAIYILK